MGRYLSTFEDDVLQSMQSYVERVGYLDAHLAFQLIKEFESLQAEIRRLEDERDAKLEEVSQPK